MSVQQWFNAAVIKLASLTSAAAKQLLKYTKVNSVQKVHSATDPSIFGQCNGLPCGRNVPYSFGWANSFNLAPYVFPVIKLSLTSAAAKQLLKYTKVNSVQKVHSATDLLTFRFSETSKIEVKK